MPSRWKKLFSRSEAAPVVVQTMAPIEVPVITEVKRRIARGEVAYAIQFGFLKALEDAQTALRLSFPPSLTYREIVESVVMPAMAGGPAEFYQRLYRFYEPVRYGKIVPENLDEFLAILTSIYAFQPLLYLYAAQASSPATGAAGAGYAVPPPPPPPPPPSGVSPAPSYAGYPADPGASPGGPRSGGPHG